MEIVFVITEEENTPTEILADKQSYNDGCFGQEGYIVPRVGEAVYFADKTFRVQNVVHNVSADRIVVAIKQ